MQPLSPIPHITTSTPTIDSYAILQLFDAFPVELNCQLFMTWNKI